MRLLIKKRKQGALFSNVSANLEINGEAVCDLNSQL